MTQNWISQVVSILASFKSKDSDTLLHRILFMKSWYRSKNLCEYCCFLGPNSADASRPNFIESSCQQ